MVQFGKLEIPSLMEDSKNKQVENGVTVNVVSGNQKEFKCKGIIALVIYVLIIFAIVLRAIITEYAPRNELMSWYQALSMLALVLLPVFVPSKDEKLPMHTFAKTGALVLCVFDVLFGAIALFVGSPPSRAIPVVVASMTTSVLLTYLGSHFRIFDYKPFDENEKYVKSRTIYRASGHGVYIRESRPFHIVLENTGSQSIALAGLSIERCTIVANRRSIAKFKLSLEGTIDPGHTIMIVPETEKDNAPLSAVTVPCFRCFGVDAGEKITTKLFTEKKDLAQMEENFDLVTDSINALGFAFVTEVVNTRDGEKTVEVK